MNAFLMFRDRDFELGEGVPTHEADLRQDLELDRLFGAMALGDPFLFDVARSGVLTSLDQAEAILYRQGILSDCLARPDIVRELYRLVVDALAQEKALHHWVYSRSVDGLLRESIEVLELFLVIFRRLRGFAEGHAGDVRSEGFVTLFAMLAGELDDGYLGIVEEHLEHLRFRDGFPMSVALGAGNKGTDYVLRRPVDVKRSWLARLLGRDRPGYVYEVPDRDEAGHQSLAELRAVGISPVAIALGRSVDHIRSFFATLQSELGFYVGCLNLADQLRAKGEPVCVPVPQTAGEGSWSARGLYDVCLSLGTRERVVSNDLQADGRSLVLITGPNRGGKSTFLRSLGIAQLMMQCGMYVPADSFQSCIRRGLFTHFKREEDATMKHGKLAEELVRMSWIVDHLTPDSLVLLNESFASTNEREGSEIARQIVRALLDSGVAAAYVTHMFDLAHGLFAHEAGRGVFLRAERGVDGARPFRVAPGEPLPTSHGEDIYRGIFGTREQSAIGVPA